MSGSLLSSAIERDPPVRYHLLLTKSGGDSSHGEAEFRELVAAHDAVQTADGWRGTVEAALDISSVEADARLARWSRRTGGLAVRITRPDPSRWWLAVHHDGQRLFAMIHTHPTDDGSVVENPMFSNTELGRDPMLDLVAVPELNEDGAAEVRRDVAATRAAQLAGALATGAVDVDEERLAGLLADEHPRDGNLERILNEIGAGKLFQLAERKPLESLVGHAIPATVQAVVGRAMVSGCALPVVMGSGLFVVFSRMAMRATGSPMASLMFGGAVAWAGMYGLRQMLGAGPPPEPRKMLKSAAMGWAADGPSEDRPIRPTAAALDTWGGLFYLLRDIAFFAGIDRPKGPMTLYLEAWALGPTTLVQAINQVASKARAPDALYDAAATLVTLRQELIDKHLDEQRIVADTIADRVRKVLKEAV